MTGLHVCVYIRRFVYSGFALEFVYVNIIHSTMKEGAQKETTSTAPGTLSWERTEHSKALRRETTKWWLKNRPKSYATKGIAANLGQSKELHLPRYVLGK